MNGDESDIAASSPTSSKVHEAEETEDVEAANSCEESASERHPAEDSGHFEEVQAIAVEDGAVQGSDTVRRRSKRWTLLKSAKLEARSRSGGRSQMDAQTLAKNPTGAKPRNENADPTESSSSAESSECSPFSTKFSFLSD